MSSKRQRGRGRAKQTDPEELATLQRVDSQGTFTVDLTAVSCSVDTPSPVTAGGIVILRAQPNDKKYTYSWTATKGTISPANAQEAKWDTTGYPPGTYTATVTVSEGGKPLGTCSVSIQVAKPADPPIVNVNVPSPMTVKVDPAAPPIPVNVANTVSVSASLRRTEVGASSDQVLWAIIRNRTQAISFPRYKNFIDAVMCTGKVPGTVPNELEDAVESPFSQRLPFPFVDAFTRLKVATEFFLMQECGVSLSFNANNAGFDLAEESGRLGRPVTVKEIDDLRKAYLVVLEKDVSPVLPYFKDIRDRLSELPLKPSEAIPNCYGILHSKLSGPCLIELIWSYWQEEGMLVQTLNAISLRFQNRRTASGKDALTRFDLDPIRPLNNLLWGYIQDEQHRLSLVRRAYEYDHHYGLTLYGKAVPKLNAVDSRSKFIEAFHNLLYRTSLFFKEDDDTTMIADGFEVLNALREVHLLLAHGAHNQFGDLPSTARAEMLIEQWLLARPEIREFLGGKIMVPYAEPWMDRVDTMKSLQGWTDTSITYFHDLAVNGEQILLSVRYGNWSVVNNPAQAANWARYWRPEIQRYIHAYRAVTGVDLTVEVIDTKQASERYLQPSAHLRNRLATQLRNR